MAITKPQLNIAQALSFAAEQPKNENTGKGRGRPKKSIKRALNALNKNNRIFLCTRGG